LIDPVYLQDGNFIDLSEFKTYLISYGKKYGIQNLKSILHDQFFKRIKISSTGKQNLNELSNNKENSSYQPKIDTSNEHIYESNSDISVTSTDLLNELEKEIEDSINKTGDKSFCNETIARCTSFTEIDTPYEEPSVKNYREMLNLQRNNYSAPPPTTLILQCCPSPKSKNNGHNNVINSNYSPKFNRKVKEEFLKKKFKKSNIYDSIDISHDINYEYSSSGSDSEYNENYDDNENSDESYSNSDSEENSDDDFFFDKSIVNPYEIMNYKVQMYNNKRKYNIEKSKANEKVEDEELPIFKDFLYPRWYQHQRYYTNESGFDLKSINGLYGVNLSDSENDE